MNTTYLILNEIISRVWSIESHLYDQWGRVSHVSASIDALPQMHLKSIAAMVREFWRKYSAFNIEWLITR